MEDATTLPEGGSGNLSPRGRLVREVLLKNPGLPSRAIARFLWAAYPAVFASVEEARGYIRYYRGASGQKSRESISEETVVSRYPDGEMPEYKPFVLGADAYPAIIFSDTHVPYHDEDVLDIMTDRAVAIGAKTIIVNGDFFDFHQISKFTHDPRLRSPAEELEVGVEILTTMQRETGARVVFKFGNHEDRFDTYQMGNAPETFEIEEIQFQSILKGKAPFLEIVKDKRVVKLGSLHIIHGHEYMGGIFAPVNPARTLFLKAKKNALCGHFHQISEHQATAINGDMVSTWSLGCTCYLHPMYRPLNEWAHGFAEVESDEGIWSVKNRRIMNYRVV